tara:strand:- start:74 stop:670 length:597 start_codon:yes stop_codon:yes gene_type:complete
MTDPYKCLNISPFANSMDVEKSRFNLIESIEDEGYGPGDSKYREIIWSADLLKDRERRSAYEKTILSKSLNNIKGLEISDVKDSLLQELRTVLGVDAYLAIINDDFSDFDFSFSFFSVDEHLDAGRILAAFLLMISVYQELEDQDVKPRVLFKISDFFSRRIKDKNWAKVFWKKIVKEYPKSREALRAEDLLSDSKNF